MRRGLEETSHSDGSEGAEGAEFPEYIAFGVLAVAMALGILTKTTLAKWLPLPYTVLLLIWGGIFGTLFTEIEDPFNPALNNGIEAWLSMDPRVLQIIFFPILIFASAFNAQFHILERRLPQILFLAVPGVIIGAGLTAAFMKFILPYDWDWNLCLVFGSMVAATDPVAVVALLEELGVSEKLGTLIEGESLLNDGSAIVVFEVFIEAVEGKSRNWHEILEFGARLALGGPAIGAAIGVGGAFILGYVINDPLVEVSLTVLLAFVTFALCESTDVKVSGVLGIVACGVVLSYYGKPRVSSSVLPSLMDFWKTLQFFADTTIFFLSGLIVMGVAVSKDRAIDVEDFGYLLALFVALYIIRGIVILVAYPVLRSGEYKINVPQMMVLTHSGLRGAVALILALVVDGVHEIEREQRDKIVFLTAGIAVLSLLVNGTTTGPLVRFLKLDRASEASESVFENACFALELSMQKQEHLLKEDPFLGDANWNLVWRYIPLFTAESYWTRLSKGSIVMSNEEVEDIRAANCRANCRTDHRTLWQTCADWVRNKKGGLSYVGIPHRLRFPWFAYHTEFLFKDAGGAEVWGELDSFLANHTAGDDSAEAWTGHLKHSRFHGDHSSSNNDHHTSSNKSTAQVSPARGAEEKSDTRDASLEIPTLPDGVRGPLQNSSVKDGGLRNNSGGIKAKLQGPIRPTEHTLPQRVHESGQFRFKESGHAEFSADKGGGEDGQHGGDLSRRMFQRAASMARAAGMNVELSEKMGESDAPPDKGAMLEARLRFLASLKAEYFKAKREGKLGSSGLRVLTEAINNTRDKVDKGAILDGWSELRGHFKSGWVMKIAKYMNWWPARPVAAAAIARLLSFQIDLAWNFLEAHHESNIKSLLADNGQVSKVQRSVNVENQDQIDSVEKTISNLTVEAPMVMRSVKTRTAARMMIQRFREAAELLAENGHLDEKEEEVLMVAATEGEMQIAYHPNLEQLPPLSRVLEKVEFLAELDPKDRQRLMDVKAAYYNQYVGEVCLTRRGRVGAHDARRGVVGDKHFRGWFYVVRGQVEKEWKAENGELESGIHSSGLLFGITDSMLNIPHHAEYTTHGFSNLVVFDQQKLLEEAKTMPSLDVALWKSVAAHCLRRSIRFHKYKLQSCHSLMDRATFEVGKTGESGEEDINLAPDEDIILVRGRIMNVEGKVTAKSLGQAETSVAPVLLQPNGRGEGGTVTISGDFKAFRMPMGMLTTFAREEQGRMHRQESMKRASKTLSTFEVDADGNAKQVGEDTPETRASALIRRMESEMAAKFDLHSRTATVGVKAAMRLMTGVKQRQAAARDGEPGGGDGGGDGTYE